MINNAPYHNAPKIGKRKSLRDKLVRKVQEMGTSAKEDTQIILLDTDGSSSEENLNVVHTFDKALDRWNSYHAIDSDSSNHVLEKYEEILTALITCTIDSKKNELPDLTAKALIDNSKAKDILLGLNRIDRKKIFKRLESLINNFHPIYWSFRDPRVQKIVISEHIKFQLDQNISGKTNTHLLKNEIILLKNIISQKYTTADIHGGILLSSGKTAVLATRQAYSLDTFILKRVNQKAPNLLDLMRGKLISLEHGNFAIKYIKKYNTGLLINGAPSSGKTKLLIALASSIASSKNVAITGNLIEYKNCLKDFFAVNIPNSYTGSDLDRVAQEISQNGATVFIADDAQITHLALAWLLYTKHSIPSIIAITGRNAHNSLYHSLHSALTLLNYTGDRDFFYWNFTTAFPLFIDLNKTDAAQQAILQNIIMKSNMPCLEPSDMKKLLEHG